MPSSELGPLLRLENARLGYPGVSVLEGVDLEVRSGEFWFLIGPNGSGKTTLLRTLLGLIRPLAGSVGHGLNEAAADHDVFTAKTLGVEVQRMGVTQQRAEAEVFRPTDGTHGRVQDQLPRCQIRRVGHAAHVPTCANGLDHALTQ